jgi:hypothetical protein
MPLRTCVKPVGTLTVKLLREQKMTTDVKIHEEIHKRYAQHLAEAMGKTKEILAGQIIGDAWGLYANVATTTNTWEMKVDFND